MCYHLCYYFVLLFFFFTFFVFLKIATHSIINTYVNWEDKVRKEELKSEYQILDIEFWITVIMAEKIAQWQISTTLKIPPRGDIYIKLSNLT